MSLSKKKLAGQFQQTSTSKNIACSVERNVYHELPAQDILTDGEKLFSVKQQVTSNRTLYVPVTFAMILKQRKFEFE
jgi:hypothetical protein